MDLESANKSIEELRRIADESKNRSHSVKFMQLLCHTDVHNICWFLDHSKKIGSDLVDLNQKLVEGISATIKVAENGGKRDAVIASLKKVLKDSGYEIVQ